MATNIGRGYYLGLQDSVSYGSYDKTKTSALGRFNLKTINGFTCLGVPLNQFVDTFTYTGVAPSLAFFNASAGRLYVVNTSATPTVGLFNVNAGTGEWSYVGKITATLANAAATTYVMRSLEVDDSNTSNIKIYISATSSVAINQGTQYINKVALSDFTVGGTAIFAAITDDSKGVYFPQSPVAAGASWFGTTTHGARKSPDVGDTRLYQLFGAAATPMIAAWDMAITPIVDKFTGINAQTTLYAGTSPSAFFTSGATSLATITANSPMVLVGTVPTGFTATTQIAVATVYFIRDIQNVLGNWFFNLSATSGGAAITPGSNVSGFQLMRAFGTTVNQFYGRSPVAGFTTLFSGQTLIQTASFDISQPTSVPANPSINGQYAFTVGASAAITMTKVSDIFIPRTGTLNGTTTISGLSTTADLAVGMSVGSRSIVGIANGATIATIVDGSTITISVAATISGATALVFGTANAPSATSTNILGTGIDITTPAATLASYSSALDAWVYLSTQQLVVKKQIASQIITTAGGFSNKYYETMTNVDVTTAFGALNSFTMHDGWFCGIGTTTGQRGVFLFDFKSDYRVGFSKLISKIQTVPNGAKLRAIDAIEELFDTSGASRFYVRSSNNLLDTMFDSPTLGFVQINEGKDITTALAGQYYQVAMENITLAPNSGTPAQVRDFRPTLQLTTDGSDNWVGDVDNSSQNGANPMLVAARLQTAYDTVVPKIYFYGFDDSGNLIYTFDTVNDAANFTYSSNDGLSWSPLGTIPNVALTTRLRLQVTNPVSSEIRWAISE